MHNFARTDLELRRGIVDAVDTFVRTGRILWPGDQSIEEWKQNMRESGNYGDETFLRITASILNRQIAIIPIFKDEVYKMSYHLNFTLTPD